MCLLRGEECGSNSTPHGAYTVVLCRVEAELNILYSVGNKKGVVLRNKGTQVKGCDVEK
jgi:hypothetical protein